MEFICVLSVGGSLASYLVREESGNKYAAVLRTNSGKRDDVPVEIFLERKDSSWEAKPGHPEIVAALTHAIDANP